MAFCEEIFRVIDKARILIVGIGGLGCSSARAIVMLGGRNLRIVDADKIESTNLDRQVLYSQDDVGKRKVDVARRQLEILGATVDAIPTFLDRANLYDLTHDVDLIIDGTDNAGSRELINRSYVTLGKPVIFGAATRSAGHTLVCAAGRACYRCVWKDAWSSETCESSGVSVSLVRRIGEYQAEVAKSILCDGVAAISNNLTTFNEETGTQRALSVDRFPACPICGSPSV